jgi:hypothetical protein
VTMTPGQEGIAGSLIFHGAHRSHEEIGAQIRKKFPRAATADIDKVWDFVVWWMTADARRLRRVALGQEARQGPARGRRRVTSPP